MSCTFANIFEADEKNFQQIVAIHTRFYPSEERRANFSGRILKVKLDVNKKVMEAPEKRDDNKGQELFSKSTDDLGKHRKRKGGGGTLLLAFSCSGEWDSCCMLEQSVTGLGSCGDTDGDRKGKCTFAIT